MQDMGRGDTDDGERLDPLPIVGQRALRNVIGPQLRGTVEKPGHPSGGLGLGYHIFAKQKEHLQGKQQ